VLDRHAADREDDLRLDESKLLGQEVRQAASSAGEGRRSPLPFGALPGKQRVSEVM
jgi:hypothetical protein